MNPFYWFLTIAGFIFAVTVGGIIYLGFPRIMARHVQTNMADYVYGGCMTLIAGFSMYQETFSKITPDVMESMSWVDWSIAYFKPIAAMLGSLVLLVKPWKKKDTQ